MSADSPLMQVFRAAAPEAVPPAEHVLGAWVETARAAWPEIVIQAEDFVAHLARHATSVGAEPPNVVDLYLACACAAGNPKAIAALETHCIANVGKAIWQVGAVDREDVLQRVREALLVSTDARPLIARYAGRGSLRGWVRSIALRTAIKHAHATHRMVALDEPGFLELAAASEDPALEPYKQRYRDEFRAAFRTAVEALTVRHRNVLRHYFIDHLTIDELGALYRVHRATAARWIHEVRLELVKNVRRELEARLAIDVVEFRDLINLVASQLELSLERLVGEPCEGLDLER